MRKLFFLILVVAPLIFLSGCDEDKKYTITFDTNGGKFLDNSTTKYVSWPDNGIYPGVECARPTDFHERCVYNYPWREGYFFVDWKSNKDGTGFSYSDVDIYSLHADIILYAQWTPNNEGYTIHFNSMTDFAIPSMTGIDLESAVSLPTNADFPAGSSKLFGWHIDDVMHNNKLHTKNLILSYYPFKNVYLDAFWFTLQEPASGTCTVNIDLRGGVLDDPSVLTQEVPCGSEISLPSASKDGIPVSGWISSYIGCYLVYPGKSPVLRDMTLYAVWE